MSPPRTAAVVGAGPAGLFTMDALIRLVPGIRVDVFERLPTPFGLIRAGVAPDHQGTKAVVRQFERAFAGGAARLFADCEVGSAIQLSELAAAYDLRFLATGAGPRSLGVEGAQLKGVYPAADFMGWLNGHPERAELQPLLGERVLIIGGGNVALDVARVLAKSRAELAASDLCVHAEGAIERARTITVVTRARPEAAKFSVVELEAFARLERARIVCRLPDDAQGDDPRVRALSRLAGAAGEAAVELEFRFELEPARLVGEAGQVSQAVFRGADGDVALAADTVIAAIGQEPPSAPSDGWWPVGWAAGEGGDIPGTRAAVQKTVRAALDQYQASVREPAEGAWESLLEALRPSLVDWSGWKRIDQAELAAAKPPRPREKLVTLEGLRRAAHCHETKR